MPEDLFLARVSLGGTIVRRLSAVLHLAELPGGDRPKGGWWVSLACDPMPKGLVRGAEVELHASTVSGREVRGLAAVAERRDDAYGTSLVLSGLTPLGEAVTDQHRAMLAV